MSYKKSAQEMEESKISKINAAGLINLNLENLWKDCSQFQRTGDYLLWNRSLDSIWIVLGGDTVEGGKEDLFMKAIDLKIYETGSLARAGATSFNSKPEEEHNKRSLQYLYLMKKSLFLRRLQNQQGKGTAYSSEDEDEFD